MNDLSLPLGYDPREPQFLAPAPRVKDNPICPVCGEECSELYTNKDGEIVGCDACVSTKDAWEWLEEQEDEGW